MADAIGSVLPRFGSSFETIGFLEFVGSVGTVETGTVEMAVSTMVYFDNPDPPVAYGQLQTQFPILPGIQLGPWLYALDGIRAAIFGLDFGGRHIQADTTNGFIILGFWSSQEQRTFSLIPVVSVQDDMRMIAAFIQIFTDDRQVPIALSFDNPDDTTEIAAAASRIIGSYDGTAVHGIPLEIQNHIAGSIVPFSLESGKDSRSRIVGSKGKRAKTEVQEKYQK